MLPPGASLGNGLTPEAAKDLGLPTGTAVAASLIDAHAGGLGNFSLHAYGPHCVQMEGSPEPNTPLSCFQSKGQGLVFQDIIMKSLLQLGIWIEL